MIIFVQLLMTTVTSSQVVDDRTIIQAIFNGTEPYDSDYSPAMFDKNHNIVSGEIQPLYITARFRFEGLHLDQVEQLLHLDFIFEQKWKDSRLAFSNNPVLKKLGKELPPFINLPMSMYKQGKLWFPDTFFPNAWSIRRHDFEHPNVLVRIYKNGNILYNTRLDGKFFCPMNFDDYPFDRQTCAIDIASYGDRNHKIKYKLDHFSVYQYGHRMDAMLRNFKIVGVEPLEPSLTGDIKSSKTNQRANTTGMRIVLHRKTSGEIKLFVPGFTTVIIAWTTFLSSFDDKFRLPAGGALVAIYVYYYSVAPNNLPLGGSNFALTTWHQLTIAFLIMAVIKNIFVRNDTGLFSFRDLCNCSKFIKNQWRMMNVTVTPGEDNELQSTTEELYTGVSFREQYVSYVLKRLYPIIYFLSVVMYLFVIGFNRFYI